MLYRSATVALLCYALCSPAMVQAEAITLAMQREQAFQTTVRPFLKTHCLKCHSGQDPQGELALDVFEKAAAVTTTGRKVWLKVREKLLAQAMPPEDEPRPAAKDIEPITNWIDEAMAHFDCSGPADPGHETIHRLNRAEYRNTIRDLLGVDFTPGDDFPIDDVGYGFDNIGDVLTLPPILMEKYLAAAEQIAAKAIMTEPHRRIFFVLPGDKLPAANAARQILQRLASRAYRRPIAADQLDRLLALVSRAQQRGDTFEESIQLALQVMLVSPHFLFRVELDPPSDEPRAVRQLNEYELATRMSYFLWSSMPDEELFDQAKKAVLRKNLTAQVQRMLKDPKSHALVENFALQWLQVRNLKMAAPDKNRFPAFDEALRGAMRTETAMFFAALLREDRGVLELIDADFTFLNGPLAKHYGIEGVEGDEMRRVSVQGTPRGGVLTQASVLTVTSNPTRTSPVKRGKWILENILGSPPPAPPADVPKLKEDDKATLSGTLRQRLEQHRNNPRCAVCHEEMDTLGFALENFDAVGGWRTKEGDFTIDASGTLPGGRTFAGPVELKAILLAGRKDDFVRCLTEKMLTYALGRGIEYYDSCAVRKITAALADNNYKFSTLFTEIILSEPFQKRRGIQRSQP